MTKKLNLAFKTTENKTATLSLVDPRDDLTRAEALAVMQTIVEKDIFTTGRNVHFASVADVTIKTTDETALL